ncbi:GmrSD restriction endonuclease domain-containing protein [Hwanghaeella sp. LZ110]|uniref:GmrSD restriction endonuclease domain-containing protein n=1 Tax=Hwanghaeella sp. LZ110 TaxID=3402810 RepID=UPI003B67350F
MKISTALDKIDEHQLFVPAFQREYVWKREDAKQLIDSLIKDYPTGTMLTWETSNPPELKGPYKYDEKQGAVRILLDGQQRLTTLYMLIKGEVPPYYTAAEILNDTRGLHVNVETLELEYFSKTKMENDPRWQNITDVFQRKVRAKDIIRGLEEKGEDVNRARDDLLDDNMRAIENILAREFPEQTVPVRATVREAIDIFYKVNASGVSLTDAELALAQISGYWPEARDIFKRKLTELQKQGFVLKLDFVVYVLLGCMYHLGSDMKKLHGVENSATIRDAWKLLDDSVLDYVVSLMKSHAYIDHTDEINSVYALVPIITYCFGKKGKHLNDVEIRKAIKWFFYSQIRTRYISQLQQKLDRDLRVVRDIENPFDELLAVIEEERRLKITPEEFVARSISHPLFGLLRWYLKSKGAFCFTTGVELRQTMGKKYSLENDHIFPYSRLKAEGYGRDNRLKYSLAQELTNRAIITKYANRSKGMKAAEDYLADVKQRFPNGLKLQCIPEDPELWKIENYEQFLQERRKILAKELNAFLEGITDTRPSETPITLEDMIAEGEGEELEFKSSLRWDYVEGTVNKKLEDVVLKTVAAFANSQGGTLLIGVKDDGEILGLEGDYHSLGQADRDKYELHLRNLLNNSFGTSFVTSKIRVAFPEFGELEICQVDVQPASNPVIIKLKDKNGQPQERFYVRSGNSSQEISLGEMHSYTTDRFS